MNELMDTYSSKGFSVLGVACNQFGHQENCKSGEMLTMLKHIRPGNGFVPNFDIFAKMDVSTVCLPITNM